MRGVVVGAVVAQVLALTACGRVSFEQLAVSRQDAPSTIDDASPDALVLTGLIHHWPCDETPGSTIAQDIVGGANATMTNPASFDTTTKQVGSASLASNAGGFAYVLIPSDLVGKTQLTMSAWFKRAAPNGVEQLGQELGAYNSPNNRELSIQYWNDGLLYICVGDTGPCGHMPSNDTNWHFTQLVFDGSQPDDATRLVLYLDRVKQTLTYTGPPAVPSTTPTVSGNRFELGSVSNNEGLDTGWIDDVRIYDHALSAAEIALIP